MNDFLKNLKQSLEIGIPNEVTINKISEINEILTIVNNKYGDENEVTKLSDNDLLKLSEKVDDLIGEKKKGSNESMLEYLDALQQNVVSKAELNIEDVMLKSISIIVNNYDMTVNGLLLDEFGVKNKEIEDVDFDIYILEDISELLSTICLFEIEYADYLEDNVFYNNDLLTIKRNILNILKK